MRLAAAALLSLAFVVAPAGAQDDVQKAKEDAAVVAASTEAAVKAAASWLTIVDAGKYGDSWSAAASALRGAVTQAKWEEGLRAVRAPIGAAGARTLTSSHYTHALPGAPAGEYVVLQYSTEFAGKPGSTEMVVPMREPDGSWKVSGYYIR
ncbi:DUF4019 domain-containing protein [Massilia sp. G4R7]|uniref:DUF4019 domain-containing protein n=1 Tax=Massilia phyllostachyos TaxID=2898585 RepID=A0ABS8Q9T7_9BURK|nr:DUF4019 domain-containing protein [Massilia phyllostachyos]MCD2518524.1 DUF4019 domain-containing protein [Massilia phyllostachyos]